MFVLTVYFDLSFFLRYNSTIYVLWLNFMAVSPILMIIIFYLFSACRLRTIRQLYTDQGDNVYHKFRIGSDTCADIIAGCVHHTAANQL